MLNEITVHMQRWAPGPHQILITNRLGQPVRRNSFGWREAVAAARTCGKLPAQPSGRHRECRETCADPVHHLPAGTHFHGMRHFYASVSIAANLHPKIVQERLGHATISETLDTYSHLFPAAEESGRGAVDAKFSGERDRRAPEAPLCSGPATCS